MNSKLFHLIANTMKAVPLLRRLEPAVSGRTMAAMRDRRHLERVIFPWVATRCRRVLFAGTSRVPDTRRYEDHFPNHDFVTIDRDPRAAAFGARTHMVADLRSVSSLFPPGSFDCVIVNGVIGWGLAAGIECDEALVASQQILRPRGLLVLGWNADRTPDPQGTGVLRRLFNPIAIEGRTFHSFSGTDHVYSYWQSRIPLR